MRTPRGAVLCLALTLATAAWWSLGAQEVEQVRGPDQAPAGVLEIAELSVAATGMTRPEVLILVSGLEAGQRFMDRAVLEAALARARQDLMNRRVFDEIQVRWSVVGSDAELGADAEPAAGADGVTPVSVHFEVDDGWTLLPIPFYRYDTNTGHNPFIVVYWDNALGTLTDFGLSAGYFSRDWVTPFRWDIRLDWDRVRWLDRTWNVSLDHVFSTEEQASPLGDVAFAYAGYATSFSVGTGFRLNDWLRYSIRPSVAAEYGFDTRVANPNEELPPEELLLGWSHSLGTGRTDWIGNLRRGWGSGLSHAFSVNPANGSLRMNLGGTGTRHWVLSPRLGPSARLRVDHDVFDDSLSRGGVVRGVANNRIFGQTMLSGNAQLAMVVLDAERALELQLVPFVDAAVTRKQGQPISGDDVFMGIGADLIAFPDFLRGFEARASFGLDVRDLATGQGARLEFLIANTLQF